MPCVGIILNLVEWEPGCEWVNPRRRTHIGPRRSCFGLRNKSVWTSSSCLTSWSVSMTRPSQLSRGPWYEECAECLLNEEPEDATTVKPHTKAIKPHMERKTKSWKTRSEGKKTSWNSSTLVSSWVRNSCFPSTWILKVIALGCSLHVTPLMVWLGNLFHICWHGSSCMECIVVDHEHQGLCRRTFGWQSLLKRATDLLRSSSSKLAASLRPNRSRLLGGVPRKLNTGGAQVR